METTPMTKVQHEAMQQRLLADTARAAALMRLVLNTLRDGERPIRLWVTEQERQNAAAWTDGKDVWLTRRWLTQLAHFEPSALPTVAAGMAYHELGHILWTPNESFVRLYSASALAGTTMATLVDIFGTDALRAADLNVAHFTQPYYLHGQMSLGMSANVLEDGRIERLLIKRHAGMRRHLDSLVLRIIRNLGQEEGWGAPTLVQAFTLVSVRRERFPKLHSMLRQMILQRASSLKGGARLEDVPLLLTMIDRASEGWWPHPYERWADTVAQAWGLGAAFNALFGHSRNTAMGEAEDLTKVSWDQQGEPDLGEPAPKQNRHRHETQAHSGQGSAGEASGEARARDAEDAGDAGDAGDGEGVGDDERAGDSDAHAEKRLDKRHLEKAMEEAEAESATDKTDLVRDLWDSLEPTAQDFMEVMPRAEVSPERGVPEPEISAFAARVSRSIQQMRAQVGGGWVHSQRSGRVSMRSLTSHSDTHDGRWFRRHLEDRSDDVSAEVVILVDTSASMSPRIQDVAQVAWGLAEAMRLAELPVSVLAFDSISKILWQPGERPVLPSHISLGGSTNPTTALTVAQQQLVHSSKRWRLMLMISDGEWTADQRAGEESVRIMQRAGVDTVMVALARMHEDVDPHGMEVIRLDVVTPETLQTLLAWFQRRLSDRVFRHIL